MSFFGPQQQMPPQSMFGMPQQQQAPMSQMMGGGMPPQMGQMGQQQPVMPQMPMQGMNPVNLPQVGSMSPQMPMPPSNQMNPFASPIGNQGGAMNAQGMENGTAGGGNGGGGLTQILNSILANEKTNGFETGNAPGSMDITAMLDLMRQQRG